MAEAADKITINKLKRQLLKAQELGREAEDRRKELSRSLQEKVHENLSLRESLASQELLMGEDLGKAAKRIEALSKENRLYEAANDKLAGEVSKLQAAYRNLGEHCADVSILLNRIPLWIRRIFRAAHPTNGSRLSSNPYSGTSAGK